jgi:DnaJ-class molecular chaperone
MDGTRARALLGVSAHATPDELRRAFRRRAQSTHPDCGGDAVRFDETMVAFRSLSSVATAAHAATVEHTPFDAYDTTKAARASRRERPSFAEILERVAIAA